MTQNVDPLDERARRHVGGFRLPAAALRLTMTGAAMWVGIQVVGIVVGLTLVGRDGGGAVQGWDDRVHDWFIGHRGGLIGISKVIAVVGDAPKLGAIVVLATCVVCAWAWIRAHNVRWRNLGVFVAFLGAEATVYVVRVVIHRPRPLSAVYPHSGAVQGIHETSWSFPSGHATGSMAVLVAIAGVIFMRSNVRWAFVAAVAGAICVATTRLVLGVHWFSDVTTGAVLGGIWGATVCWMMMRCGDESIVAREPDSSAGH